MENIGVLSAIGKTPVVKLNRLFAKDNINIDLYAKLENMNSGGSAKDRSAYSIMKNAMETGKINSDTVVIESSSGNFGIALAKICLYYHIRFICVVDIKTTKSNMDILKLYGAELDYIDVPDRETGEFMQARLKRVQELLTIVPNSYHPNQYENMYGPAGHKIAAEELMISLDNHLDYIFIAVSTYGTIRGYWEYLTGNNLKTKLIAVDAVGSNIFGGSKCSRLIPGHGAAVRSGLFRQDIAYDFVQITDAECIEGCYKLLREEGIFAGGSTGAVVSAIEKYIPYIPANSNCAFIVHDCGERYLDTIYSEAWAKKYIDRESSS